MASRPPVAGPRPGSRLLKVVGIALAAILVACAAAVGFVSSRWFAAALEAGLSKQMQEGHRRTLKFEGPLEFFFWPDAGFRVGRIALSEPGSAAEFASLDSAAFLVRVAPLLARQVVIDQCTVEGLKLAIVRHRDGSLNIDDLMSPSQASGGDYRIEAAKADLNRASVAWIDESSGSGTTATDLALSGADLQVDTAAKSARGSRISLAATVDDAHLRLGLENPALSAGAFRADRMNLGLEYRSAGTAVKGSLGARLAADSAHGTAALDDLSGNIELIHPRLVHPLDLPLKGALHASRAGADGKLSSHFDESTASIAVQVKRFSPPAIHFDIDVDRLDVSRYLAPAHAEGGAAKPASETALALPRGLQLDGVAKIGSLDVAGMKTHNIRLEIRSEHGEVGVRGLAAAAGR